MDEKLAGPAVASAREAAPALRDYLGVSLYWFALSLFWGAMLTIVLPTRVLAVTGPAAKDVSLGLVCSVGAAVAALTQITSGALSDVRGLRWGRRRPYLLVGTLLCVPALLAFPRAGSLGTILAVYIAIQFLLNIAIGPYQALIPDIIPLAYHGRASAFMGLWTLLGRIGGPLMATLLLPRPDGLAWCMGMFAVLLVVFMAVNVAIVRERPAPPARTGFAATVRGLYRVPLRPYPSFVWMLVSRFGIMMGVYSVIFCLFYYVRFTLGAPSEASASEVVFRMMAIAAVTGLAGTLPAGHLSDVFLKKQVLYVSNSICIVSALGFLMAGSYQMAYVAVAVFGFGYGAFQAVDWALGCNVLPEHARAKYLGVWGLSDTVPQVIAPPVGGLLVWVTNRALGQGQGYRALMLLSIVYFAVGTVALRGVRERRAAAQPSGQVV